MVRWLRKHERYGENTPRTSVKILAFLEENPDMPLARIAEVASLSMRAVEMAATKLVKEGHLKYIGPKKRRPLGGDQEMSFDQSFQNRPDEHNSDKISLQAL